MNFVVIVCYLIVKPLVNQVEVLFICKNFLPFANCKSDEVSSVWDEESVLDGHYWDDSMLFILDIICFACRSPLRETPPTNEQGKV